MTPLLLALSLTLAEPPKTPWVTFPAAPVQPTPEPPVPPPPQPDAIPLLRAEEFYVIDSKEDCFVLASPVGLVSVFQDQGPVRIRGRFVGGSGKPETRTYAGKAVFTVEARGQGRVELIVVKVGAKGAEDLVRKTIDVDSGEAPRPPPQPLPPSPAPTPGPSPIEGKRLLIVFNDKAALPAAQHSIIYGKTVRTYLEGKLGEEMCILPVGSDASKFGKEYGDAMARPRTSLPWVILGNGTSGYEGPLPKDVPAALALFRQFYGD